MLSTFKVTSVFYFKFEIYCYELANFGSVLSMIGVKTCVMFLRVLLIILVCEFSDCNISCNNLASCGACIQQPECIWCSDPINYVNCMAKSNTPLRWCNANVVDVKPDLNIIRSESLNSQVNLKIVQMNPQYIHLEVPRNQEHKFKFQFSRAFNPLDLYFLMDTSKTMEVHRKTLSKLSNKLVETLKMLTSDSRVGFGTFVDKDVFPFAYYNGCANCDVPTYSFTNHLNLTSSTEAFQSSVTDAPSSGNLDAPEGGFDALLQAIVCKELIGWRSQATRIIVFSTDAMFHIAGDGKLGGIAIPHDGLCHMKNNKYFKDTELDYPSISHISYLAHENNVHIIFAVATNSKDAHSKFTQLLYKELAKHVSNSKYAILDEPEKVIKVVEENYNAILSSVNITHNFPPEIDVKFKVQCDPDSQIFVDGDFCEHIVRGQVVTFEVTVKPLVCLDDINGRTFAIKPAGIDDQLLVDLNVICGCDCEKEGNYDRESLDCNYHGDKKCGLCFCDTNYSGKRCECSPDSTRAAKEDCTSPETNTTCSGNGICFCGQCQCNDRFYGKYCNCDNFSCPKVSNELCNGKDHGKCECGECRCFSGWMGKDCRCPTSSESCVAPYSSGLACSGRGKCVCGECQCNEGFVDKFCESCYTCDSCLDFNPCVEAFLRETSNDLLDGAVVNCSAANITTVTSKFTTLLEFKWNKCVFYTESGCSVTYRYKIDDNMLIVIEIEPEECPFIGSLSGLLVTIIPAILIGGLLALLVWKFIVTVKDKKEYAQFLQKRELEKWNNEENPLYKPATSVFDNPQYQKDR